MERRRYPSYLLRMWRVGPEVGDWRATLENAATRERHGFSSPQELCSWIRAQAETWEQRTPDPDDQLNSNHGGVR